MKGSKELSEERKELAKESKSWDEFCIYRPGSMSNRDTKGI